MFTYDTFYLKPTISIKDQDKLVKLSCTLHAIMCLHVTCFEKNISLRPFLGVSGTLLLCVREQTAGWRVKGQKVKDSW